MQRINVILIIEEVRELENKKILVIGSLNIDWVIPVSHMPKEGETIIGGNYTEIPGGKGANQAYGAARLGGSVIMLGMVGDDHMGGKLVNNLISQNIDVSRIERCKNINSGLAIIYVNNEGENSIVVLPGANSMVDKSYIDNNSEFISNSDLIVMQMEIPKETVYYAIEKAYAENKKIILNPAPAPEYLDDYILSKIDFFTPNETELEKLTGKEIADIPTAIEASKVLIGKGVKNVIATLGEKGSLLVSSDKTIFFEGEKVKAIDTTAAGGCFNAALAVALSEGKTIEEAIKFANKAAAISVTRKGAQPSMPFRNELSLV
jgi:ribokinase